MYNFSTAIAVAVALFVLYPPVSKKFIAQTDYRSFVLVMLFFFLLGAGLFETLVNGAVAVYYAQLPELLVLGIMYCVASYFVFWAYARLESRVGIINTVVAAQGILIAFFSSLFFARGLLPKTFIAAAFIGVGLFLMVPRGKNTPADRDLKSVFAAVVGTLIWVFMWVGFYTLPGGSSAIGYFFWLAAFAFVAACPIMLAFMIKQRSKIAVFGSRKAALATAAVGISLGVGTSSFSFAFSASPVAASMMLNFSVVAVPLLSIAILKDRFYKSEILGMAIIVATAILYYLA